MYYDNMIYRLYRSIVLEKYSHFGHITCLFCRNGDIYRGNLSIQSTKLVNHATYITKIDKTCMWNRT